MSMAKSSAAPAQKLDGVHSHKHCVFCGDEIPYPRPTNWSSVCHSEANTLPFDTVGNRHHAFLSAPSRKFYATADISTLAKSDKPSAHQALYEALSHAVAVLKSRELDARSVDSVLSTAAAALKLARGE